MVTIETFFLKQQGLIVMNLRFLLPSLNPCTILYCVVDVYTIKNLPSDDSFILFQFSDQSVDKTNYLIIDAVLQN